jgi:hypothetical protein
MSSRTRNRSAWARARRGPRFPARLSARRPAPIPGLRPASFRCRERSSLAPGAGSHLRGADDGRMRMASRSSSVAALRLRECSCCMAAWPPSPGSAMTCWPFWRRASTAIVCRGAGCTSSPSMRPTPDGVWVTEVWESEAAHAASLQLDRVKEQIARAMPILDPGGFKRQQLHTQAGIPD